jgi:hypothetical protein
VWANSRGRAPRAIQREDEKQSHHEDEHTNDRKGMPPTIACHQRLLFNVRHYGSKRKLGISSFWRLLGFEGRPRRMPYGRAESPSITFIREVKKELRNGLVRLGEGQSAISDCAAAAHGASPRWVQIALKPASESLGMHGIFGHGQCPECLIADSALERVQVNSRARWLDADEHHLGLAPRTGRPLKWS